MTDNTTEENRKSYDNAGKNIVREINGCMVRVFFSAERNEELERLVLDHLLLVFDRKVKGMSNVQT